MNIGNAIKELRKEKGLNQSELAAACDLSQTALSQIESGVKRPNPGTMKKFCDFFEVPEMIIYLLATEEIDISVEKADIYKKVFPGVKTMLLGLFKEKS